MKRSLMCLIFLLWMQFCWALSASTMTAGQFEYRELNVTMALCTGTECGSAPNLAMFLSSEVDWALHADERPLSDELDLISTFISTVASPSSLLCYFPRQNDFRFSVDWKRFLHGESGSVHIGENYQCVGIILEQIIEYRNVDDDLSYDPLADEVVSRYILKSNTTWLPAAVSRNSRSYNIDTSTHDSLLNLAFASAPTVSRSLSGALVTPNSTRMDMSISYYPYKSETGTQLALRAYIVTEARLDEPTLEERDNDVVIHMGSDSEGDPGYFSWSKYARLRYAEGDGTVKSSGEVSVTSRLFPPEKRLGQGLADAILGDDAVHYPLIISFVDEGQPVEIIWEASIGYGSPPEDNQLYDLFATLIIFGLFIVPAAVVFGVIYFRNQQQLKEEDQSLLQSSS